MQVWMFVEEWEAFLRAQVRFAHLWMLAFFPSKDWRMQSRDLAMHFVSVMVKRYHCAKLYTLKAKFPFCASGPYSLGLVFLLCWLQFSAAPNEGQVWRAAVWCSFNVSLGEKYRFFYQIIVVILELYVLSENTLYFSRILRYACTGLCVYACICIYVHALVKGLLIWGQDLTSNMSLECNVESCPWSQGNQDFTQVLSPFHLSGKYLLYLPPTCVEECWGQGFHWGKPQPNTFAFSWYDYITSWVVGYKWSSCFTNYN